MKLKNLLFLFLFFHTFTFVSFAQDLPLNDSDLKDKQVIIEKDRIIEMNEAIRSFDKINLPNSNQVENKLKYEEKEVIGTLPPINTKVKVVSVKNEKLQKYYGNLLKLGFGNFITPYAELFINNKRNDKYVYGVHFKHLSSAEGPVKNSGNGVTGGSLYGKYFLPKVVLGAEISYFFQKNYFYGYNQNLLDKSSEQVSQYFHLPQIAFQINPIPKDSSDQSFVWDAQVKLNHVTNKFIAYENEANILAKIEKQAIDKLKIKIAYEGSYSSYVDNSVSTRLMTNLTPTALYQYTKQIKFEAGFTIGFSNDTLGKYNSVNMFPKAEVTYSTLDFKNDFILGVDGGLKRTTLRNILQETPFLDKNIALANQKNNAEVYLGFKSVSLKNFLIKTKLGYTWADNIYFIAPSKLDSSKFEPFYTNAGIFNWSLRMDYLLSDKLNIHFNSSLNQYHLTTISKPWHRPALELNLGSSYNLFDKLVITPEIYYIAGLYSENLITSRKYSLNDIWDINLEVSYKFSERFNVFIDFNNILGNNYERYKFYPVKGFNLIGGLAFSF